MRRQKAVARNAELLRQVGMYACDRFHAGHCTAWRCGGVARNSSPRSPVVQPTVAWKGACCRVCLSHQPAERSRYGLCRKAYRCPPRPSPYSGAARRQALRHTPGHQSLGTRRGHTGHRHDEAHCRRDRRATVSSARNARALLSELRHATHTRRLPRAPRTTITASGATTTASTLTKPRWRR